MQLLFRKFETIILINMHKILDFLQKVLYNATIWRKYDTLKTMLTERFETIDYEKAKKDVLPFVKDASKLDLWSKDFFTSITNDLKNRDLD